MLLEGRGNHLDVWQPLDHGQHCLEVLEFEDIFWVDSQVLEVDLGDSVWWALILGTVRGCDLVEGTGWVVEGLEVHVENGLVGGQALLRDLLGVEEVVDDLLLEQRQQVHLLLMSA